MFESFTYIKHDANKKTNLYRITDNCLGSEQIQGFFDEPKLTTYAEQIAGALPLLNVILYYQRNNRMVQPNIANYFLYLYKLGFNINQDFIKRSLQKIESIFNGNNKTTIYKPFTEYYNNILFYFNEYKNEMLKANKIAGAETINIRLTNRWYTVGTASTTGNII